MRSIFLTCLLLLLLLVSALPDLFADAFQASVPVLRTFPLRVSLIDASKHRTAAATTTTTTRRWMVRNIDLPEALILYGHDVIFIDGDAVRPGLSELVQECCEVETKVIVLLEDIDGDDSKQDKQHEEEDNRIVSSLLPANNKKYNNKNRDTPTITVVRAPFLLHNNNNPAPLLDSLLRVRAQERAFGGSSGFGQKPVDPSWRSPLPARCVVLTCTLQPTRAARACGMRVIQVGDGVEDPLADYALLPGQVALDFGVDDIATPGSFWLNPPHPRDDDGNKVDPYEVVEQYLSSSATTTAVAENLFSDPKVKTKPDAAEAAASVDAADDDDYLDAILADLSPL